MKCPVTISWSYEPLPPKTYLNVGTLVHLDGKCISKVDGVPEALSGLASQPFD
jgi:hypothetical protein